MSILKQIEHEGKTKEILRDFKCSKCKTSVKKVCRDADKILCPICHTVLQKCETVLAHSDKVAASARSLAKHSLTRVLERKEGYNG